MNTFRTWIAGILAVAGVVAHANLLSAFTSSTCRCPPQDAVLDAPPALLTPLNFAFGFSRGVVEANAFQVQVQHSWDERSFEPRRIETALRSRLVIHEDEVLAELAERESEIAGALPADPRDSGAPTLLPSDSPRLIPAFDFSGGPRDDGPPTSRLVPLVSRKRKPLHEDKLLAQLAACELLIARELAGQSVTLKPKAKDAVPRVGDLIDAVAPRDAQVAIVEILEREAGSNSHVFDAAASDRVLDELDAAAYAPWADRPGRPAGGVPKWDEPAIFARRYDASPLEMAFGYSRHSLEFAGATAEFRCRCAEAAQLPGNSALHVDEVLAELAAAEGRIAAALEFPLPASMPEGAARAAERRFEQQLGPAGWSEMTIAEQTGAAARFQAVTGVGMLCQNVGPFIVSFPR